MVLLPIVDTFKTYTKINFRWDLIAGITLAMFVLPESMAYATLAGLAPEFGIYCCLVGGLFFALFTSTKKVAIGPTSAIALMIGSGVSALSDGSIETYISIATLCAFGVFVFFLSAYFLRLSSIVNFVSDTVLLGFKTGAALSIASTQLPALLGLNLGGSNFFNRVYLLFENISHSNINVLLFGIASFGLLGVLNYFFKDKPISLFLVVISILFIAISPYKINGLTLVGSIPSGLPKLVFPSINFKDIDGVLGLSFGCFLMAFIESSSVARTLAEQENETPNIRQELLALGAANFAVAFAGGFPISGGLSQSQVNSQAGAKTPVALLFCTFFLGVLLLYFTHLLEKLPEITLAVLVLFAVSHLIKIKDLLRLKKLSRAEFYIAFLAIVAVLFFGILKGVIISSFLSIIYVISKSNNPHIAILGRIPGTNKYSDVSIHQKNELVEDCLIIRVEAPLFYYNQQYVFDSILTTLHQYPTTKILIMDFSSSSHVDVAASKMIVKLEALLRNKHIQFKIVEALISVRELLRKQDLETNIGHISRKTTIYEVVCEFEAANTKQ
ncbi:MAG: DNA repair protein [Bacteroidetes bacterium B1(2017)]|nr:MAG: DNA repair protein [Bacteroidetes bacterium B1(2017)]